MRALPLLVIVVPSLASAESYVPDVVVERLDVLVVLDRSDAAADARAALHDQIGGFVTELENRFPGEWATGLDLHLGFTTDGPLVVSADCVTDVPWVSAETDQWGTQFRNFAGETSAAVTCAMPVTFDAIGEQDLVQAAVTALADNAGFRRADATLAVLFVPAVGDLTPLFEIDPDAVVGVWSGSDLDTFTSHIEDAADAEEEPGYDPINCDGGFDDEDNGGAPMETPSGSAGGCSTSGGGGGGTLLLLITLAAATARSGSRRDP